MALGSRIYSVAIVGWFLGSYASASMPGRPVPDQWLQSPAINWLMPRDSAVVPGDASTVQYPAMANHGPTGGAQPWLSDTSLNYGALQGQEGITGHFTPNGASSQQYSYGAPQGQEGMTGHFTPNGASSQQYYYGALQGQEGITGHFTPNGASSQQYYYGALQGQEGMTGYFPPSGASSQQYSYGAPQGEGTTGHFTPNGVPSQQYDDHTPVTLMSQHNLDNKPTHGAPSIVAKPKGPTKRELELQYFAKRIQAATDAYLDTLNPADWPAPFPDIKKCMKGGNIVLQELPRRFKDAKNKVEVNRLPIDLAVRLMNRSIYQSSNSYRHEVIFFLEQLQLLNTEHPASVTRQELPSFLSHWTKGRLATAQAKNWFSYVVFWDSNVRQFRSMSFCANSPLQAADYAKVEIMARNPFCFLRYGALRFRQYHVSAKVLVDHHTQFLNDIFIDKMLDGLRRASVIA